jgi:hypothetical protein
LRHLLKFLYILLRLTLCCVMQLKAISLGFNYCFNQSLFKGLIFFFYSLQKGVCHFLI